VSALARFRRVVVNEPVRPGGGPATGEELIALTLRAIGAHTRDDGRLDYAALRASGAWAAATERAARLGSVPVDALVRPAERLAFWLNVYNALVLHGVVALGLRRSVWETWNFFGRVSVRAGPHVLSLDDIEHGILRGNRRRRLPPWPPFWPGDPRRALACDPVDPRLHAAINCGALACPLVRVYRADALDRQLDASARSLVNQEVTLGADGRIACTKLFGWYRDDFDRAGGLSEFLVHHLDEGPVKAALAAGAPPCQVFRPYSWALVHPPVE
jgi:hypothetical protein